VAEEGKLIVLGQDGAIPYVVEEGMAGGSLPNFTRLAERGVFARLLPHPSAVTPGNWAHISTGALPWTTGISEFSLHKVGASFENSVPAFERQHCQAETLWEALGRRGLRCATISYPHGRPRSGELHAAIGGDGLPSEFTPYSIAAGARALLTENVHPDDPYGWGEHERITLDRTGTARFRVGPVSWRKAGPDLELSATLLDRGRVRIADLSRQRLLAEVGVGEWTPWIELCGFEGEHPATWEFRIRPRLADLASGRLALYVSALQSKEAFADPREISVQLREKLGPYTEPLTISALLNGWIDPAGMMDEFRDQAIWHTRASLYLTQELGFAAVLSKWHAFDKFYHFFFQRIDAESPLYDPDQFACYEAIHQGVLRIADEMVGVVLDGMDSNTLLIVLSDHGLMPSRRHVYVNNFLARHGFLVTTGPPARDGRMKIDWTRTRAVAHPYTQIWINTSGRDPEGIVLPGPEWESLCGDVIAALRDWKDPETGAHVMNHVFRVEDGAAYGLGAPGDGDIRFFCQAGYSAFRTTDVTVDGREIITATGPYLGDHGSCAPTARLGRGSEMAMLCMGGPNIKEGYRRLHPLRMTDVLPTALAALGWPLPRHSEGGVAMDCLRY